MKKVLALTLAIVLVLTFFSACKKDGGNEKTTQLTTETTAPVQLKEGKNFDEIKAAFDKALSGKGYKDLEECYIDNSDKYYSAIIVYQQEEPFDLPVTQERLSSLDSFFNSEDANENVKIKWDSGKNSVDLLNKYYGDEKLSGKKLEEANEKLEKLNRITTATVGNELYEITNLISFSAEIEGLQKERCELRGFAIETDKGCFLLAFDKGILVSWYAG